MFRKTSLVGFCLAALLTTSTALADEANRKTTFTFSDPVALPGLVLPAGTYMFKTVDLGGTANIVQVFNADENKVLGSFMTIPYEKGTIADTTHIWFLERKAGEAPAIHEWFYPGNTLGMEFLYR
jgi:hypothetical protein